MARIIYQPRQGHRCNTHQWRINYPRGTVARCEDCGRAYVYDPIPWERTWRTLYPWPFDRAARKALAQDGAS